MQTLKKTPTCQKSQNISLQVVTTVKNMLEGYLKTVLPFVLSWSSYICGIISYFQKLTQINLPRIYKIPYFVTIQLEPRLIPWDNTLVNPLWDRSLSNVDCSRTTAQIHPQTEKSSSLYSEQQSTLAPSSIKA